jgi:hypothetical protein
MGYQPYLNDKDAAFDRDAQNLMDYTHGYDGGYINQGYSNVAALPSQMQLARVIETRYKLNELSKAGRKEAAIERGLQQDEDEFSGFSSRIAGLFGGERVAAIQDELVRNPGLARNKDVMGTSRALFESDNYSLAYRDKLLKEKAQNLQSAQLDENAATFEDRAALARKELINAHAQADLETEKSRRTFAALEQGDQAAVGKYIASSAAYTPEEREAQDALIVLSDRLASSSNEKDKATLRSLAEITGGLATAAKVKDIRRAKIGQHSDLIASIKNATKIDLANLPADKDQQMAAIEQAASYLAKHPNGSAYQSQFDDLTQTLALSERTKGELDLAKKEVGTMVSEILALGDDPSPQAQSAMRGKLAILNARSSRLASHFVNAQQEEVEDLKRRDKESQIDRRYALSKEANQKNVRAEEKMSLDERKQAFREKLATFTTTESRLKFLHEAKVNGEWGIWGFDDEPSIDQWEKRMSESNPKPGASSKDI